MIISASRRTDIPAYYADWFLNRLHDGYVLVRNPMNAHSVSRVKLTPDVLDGIVFWTKNPIPMLGIIDAIKETQYYFQFTLTPYGEDIEPNIPSKEDVIIPSLIKLSDKIGAERIVWRYDPLILNSRYTYEFHCQNFENMAKKLKGKVRKCTFSFLDLYQNTMRNAKLIGLQTLSQSEMLEIARLLSQIASAYEIKLDTCAEQIDLSAFGIGHAHCIDQTIFEDLLGCSLMIEKDKNQRQECGCVASIDIGVYNTCPNGCLYCYANYNSGMVASSYCQHDPNSPMLIGHVSADDKVTDRKVQSYKDKQMRLF